MNSEGTHEDFRVGVQSRLASPTELRVCVPLQCRRAMYAEIRIANVGDSNQLTDPIGRILRFDVVWPSAQ